jgi:hypothetical protein
METSVAAASTSFALAAAFVVVMQRLSCARKSASCADDECQSLYYSQDIADDGRGFPAIRTTPDSVIKSLKNSHSGT